MARRGERLKAGDRKLFSGEFWTGAKALELGLIDGIGDLRSVMRERFGDKVRLQVIAAERSWLKRRLGLAAAPLLPGAEGWARGLIAATEERTIWARYGL